MAPFFPLLAYVAYNTALTIGWPAAYLFYTIKTHTGVHTGALNSRFSPTGRYATTFRARLGLELPPACSLPLRTTCHEFPLPRREGVRGWVNRRGLDISLSPLQTLAADHRPPTRRGEKIRGPSSSCTSLWIHALSVGETLSAVSLVQQIKETHPHIRIVFSTATESGAVLARERLAPWVESFFTMPHDFPWAMRCLIHRLLPELFILVETDLWPNLLLSLDEAGIPAVLVNGRLSPRSYNRLLCLRPFIGPLFRCFSAVFAQSHEDAKRYASLGVPLERLAAEGNLKSDSSLEPLAADEREALSFEAGIEKGRSVWIAGSTHEGEEPLLLDVHKALRLKHPDLLLILAPRKIERASELLTLCRQRGFGALRRSARQDVEAGHAVLVLDTLGELKRFYALAQVAFIGGSLVPFGGHNPLEATAQGLPAFWGPHAWNFRDLEARLLAAGCGFRIADKDDLIGRIGLYFENAGELVRVREAAHRFLAAQTGTTQKIMERLSEMFPEVFRAAVVVPAEAQPA